MGQVTLFISTVSVEFGHHRDTLRRRLTAPNVAVKIQEDFNNLGDQTLGELETYVKACDFVVHLVGEESGSRPAASSVAALRQRNAARLAEGDWLAAFLNSADAEALSYTQWEAYLALLHGKRLLCYAPEDRANALVALKQKQSAGAAPPPPGGQDAHALRLMAQDRFAKPFNGVEHLANQVAIAVADIYIAAGLKPPRIIDISHLPTTYANKLFGRDEEMARLQQVWRDNTVRVFAFDAMGGAGKTALIRSFANTLQQDDWGGADAVFAWSFYSQGSNEDRQTSAQEFFNAAFAFFGAEAPTQPGKKGIELAKLAAERRTLLILDGLEPLQYAAGGTGGSVSQVIGGIKDADVKALLTNILTAPAGLALVTTRIRMSDFSGRTGFDRAELDELPLMASIALLRHLGLAPDSPPDRFAMPKPTFFPPHLSEQLPADYNAEGAYARVDGQKDLSPSVAFDLVKAAQELRGHALALTLAGNYLVEHHGGDPRAMLDLPPLAHLEGGTERDPFRVMRAIELGLIRQIIDGNIRNGRPPLADPAGVQAGRALGILAFLGFFDRPAERKYLKVVFAREGALEPEAADVAIADDRATMPRILELQRQLKALDDEVPADEFAETELKLKQGPLQAEHDHLTRAQRRVAFRRVFASMRDYSEEQITAALAALAKQGLVNDPTKEGKTYIASPIDCHPLVREYFGQRLGAPESADEPGLDRALFKAAHGRMYDDYRYAGLPQAFREPVAYGVLALGAAYPEAPFQQDVLRLAEGGLPKQVLQTWPPSLHSASPEQLHVAAALIDGPEWRDAMAAFLPDNEDGMTPLFAAIHHGCAAEREDECFNEVYWPRVARGNEVYAAKKLGLFGQELAAVAAFFERPFTTPSPRLRSADQALVLNLAAFRLRGVGRLADAVAPFGEGVRRRVVSPNWKAAAADASNLSELLLTLGRLTGAGEDLAAVDWSGEAAQSVGAVAAGAASVGYADRSGDAFRMMCNRTTLAEALRRAGRLAAAEAVFRAAETRQADRQPNLPRLYSLPGYLYADLLLARGRAAEAGERAKWALQQYKTAGEGSLLDIGLDTLTAARAVLTEWDGANPEPLIARFNEALDALRRSNNEDDIPRAILARAEAGLVTGDLEMAGAMLAEAEDSAKRGPMPLFLADTYLLGARWSLQRGQPTRARTRRDAAAALIEQHQYHGAWPALRLLDLRLALAGHGDIAAAADAALNAVAGDHPWMQDIPALPDDGQALLDAGQDGDPGWWGFLPELERLLADHPAFAPRLADLRQERDAYNTARDAYLADQDAKLDAQWADEDRALADPDFRKELSAVLVANGHPPLDEFPEEEHRQVARELLQHKRKAQSPSVDPEQVPDELVEQLFGDPEALQAMEGIWAGMGQERSLDTLTLRERKALVAALMQAQQQRQDTAPDGSDRGLSVDPAKIPDDMVAEIFADENFREPIARLLSANNIDTPPDDLPMDLKRQVAAAILTMMQQQQNNQASSEGGQGLSIDLDALGVDQATVESAFAAAQAEATDTQSFMASVERRLIAAGASLEGVSALLDQMRGQLNAE